MNPETDPRLTPIERALYTRIYRVIDEVEAEFNADISQLVAENMVRRAVTRGADIIDLLGDLHAAAEHQNDFNQKSAQADLH